MNCISHIYQDISSTYDIYYDEPDFTGVFVVKISKHCALDELQISGWSKKLNNAKKIINMIHNEIEGIYNVIYPDEDTLFIMIDGFDGYLHLISNDCFYLQHALTAFVFRDRKHLNMYKYESDIELFYTDEEIYMDPFIRELDEYFEKRTP